MRDCYLGKVVPYQNGSFRVLENFDYIFVCPDCEYRWTSTTEEGIKSVRDNHNASAHPEKHLEVMYEDAVELKKEEFAKMEERVLRST